ncbi:uncharacterized protein TNCV_4658601 [Trichonephila clavipes]|nr:uncharacterized protein TNCV_4658601 [Trichonephila clavipes]
MAVRNNPAKLRKLIELDIKFKLSVSRKIGSSVGRNQTTVMRICDRWMQKSLTDRRGQLHPPQCTVSPEDRKFVYMAVTDHECHITNHSASH